MSRQIETLNNRLNTIIHINLIKCVVINSCMTSPSKLAT